MVINHKKPEAIGELTKTFMISKFLDQFPTFLREVLGTNNVALSYVIYKTVDPPLALPALILLWKGSLPHTNMIEEPISYTSHTGPAYESDNTRSICNIVIYSVWNACDGLNYKESTNTQRM